MRRRKENSILPDLIFSKFFLVFCVIVFLTILFGLAKGTVKRVKVSSEIMELQDEINQLEGQNQVFSQLINYLKTDSFIEQEARLKLGYKKPGEHLVVIPEEELAVDDEQTDKNKELSNPAKWWAYFFN